METSFVTLIICVVIVAVIAAVTAWILADKKRKLEARKFYDEKTELQKYVDESKAKEERLKIDCAKQVETAKKNIDEANQHIVELEKQLKQMLDGNIDNVVKAQLEDVDNLKKKIKKLNEEIEELTEDLEDEKAKSKKKENELLNLQDSHDEEKRKNKQLNQELEEKTNELNARLKELNLKIESLTFIQEILSAKELKVGNIVEQHKKVDEIVNFIHEDLKDCLKENNKDDYDKWIGKGLDRWAIISKKSWIAGKRTIAFVGEFSAGKTSIVNRILSQDDPNVPLLPVSAKATTAIPTYIAGEVGTTYSFVSPDNKRKNIDENTFKRVSKEVLDQVKGVSSLIQYFVMTYKNPNLAGLSVLDTPGFNSNDSEDAQRTIDVINECDALFWVFDVNAGTVNRSSISLIKKYLKKPLYVVINKIDTKPETEVNKVEQLIRKTLRDEGVEVKLFIRFSGKEPLSTIMEPIKSVEHSSEEDSYLGNIETILEKIVKDVEKEKDVALRSYHQKSQEVDRLTNQMNGLLRNLSGNCDEAANIPQFKEGFELFVKLTDDKYEMTKYQYDRFKNLLNTIKTQGRNMLSVSSNTNAMVKEKQKLYEMYSAKRELFQKTDYCLQKFNKLAQGLKNKEI